MKPVVEKVLDKDGNVIVRFNPTGAMLTYASMRAEEPELTEVEVVEKCGFSSNILSNWRNRYPEYFPRWLEEALDTLIGDKRRALEAVGMSHALSGNFQYWREMARTHGVIKEEEKAPSLTLNVGEAKLLLGGNFDEARRRILQQTRGVELPRGARVVDATFRRIEPELPEGPGDGAGEVPGGSVVLSHPVGENGKRRE